VHVCIPYQFGVYESLSDSLSVSHFVAVYQLADDLHAVQSSDWWLVPISSYVQSFVPLRKVYLQSGYFLSFLYLLHLIEYILDTLLLSTEQVLKVHVLICHVCVCCCGQLFKLSCRIRYYYLRGCLSDFKKFAQKRNHLNWHESAVDLLTLLEINLSPNARKLLAQRLNVNASQDGSPKQNMTLHKAVLEELAKNGGRVSASLTN
jgi:hypothetical protein